MDKLAQAVEKAIPKVNWFALGDAKRIAQEMWNAVRDYRRTPADATHADRLRDVANQAKLFLFHRHTEEAKATCTLLEQALAASRNGDTHK